MTENPKHSLDTLSESPQRPPKFPKTRENQNDDSQEAEEDQQDGEEESRIGKPMNQNPTLQRYLIAIEYLGTRFSGSQKQLNCRTVVGVLEEAFRKFIGQPVSIALSSRTDAGVHALSNVCHVDVERISKRKPGEVFPPHEPTVVKKAVNHFLQSEGDIMVIDVRCVPADFHARYKAQERTYFYRLLNGPEPLSIFEKDRVWHVPEELDLHAMQAACKVLVGCHDFSSFRASGCQAKSPIRTIDELNINEVISTPHFSSIIGKEENNTEKEDSCAYPMSFSSFMPISSIYNSSLGTSNSGSNVEFGMRRGHRNFIVKVRARSFLYHQVRLIVGVLKSVGTGDLTVSDVERILNAKTVTAASPMAPASGLYLGQVKYNLSQDN